MGPESRAQELYFQLGLKERDSYLSGGYPSVPPLPTL
jgi:hypothetical protein